MCDCYGHMCQLCDNVVSVHIGGFSVGREHIRVLCPDCATTDNLKIIAEKQVKELNLQQVLDTGTDLLESTEEISREVVCLFRTCQVIVHKVTKKRQMYEYKKRFMHKLVYIFCDTLKGSVIHLN